MRDKGFGARCVGTLSYRLRREDVGYAQLKGVGDRRCGTLCTPRV